MAHRIVWSRTAAQDLRSLVKYIARDNPARAEQFGYKVISNIDILQDHPHVGRIVPEFRQSELREIVVRPYRVIYRIKDSSEIIEIIRVWHAARNFPEIE